jgi:alkylhydroperoxidase family enzyme
MSSHGAAARCLREDGSDLVTRAAEDYGTAPVDAKLRALLHIAEKVRIDGRSVTECDVAAARREGATHEEIHDAVLVAAAFSMFNRYVDGLATWQPHDPAMYALAGQRLATVGYTP